MTRTLAPLAALAILAGCSGAPATETTATVTATTTTHATATVTASPAGSEIAPGSLIELRDALTEAGLACDGWQETTANSGQCSALVLLTWAPDTDAGRDMHRAAVSLALTAMSSRPDVSLLVGQRWTVRIGTVDAYTLQSRIGGTVLGATE